jgi:hypothetical protein
MNSGFVVGYDIVLVNLFYPNNDPLLLFLLPEYQSFFVFLLGFAYGEV